MPRRLLRLSAAAGLLLALQAAVSLRLLPDTWFRSWPAPAGIVPGLPLPTEPTGR